MKKKIQRTRRFYRAMNQGKRPLGSRPDGAVCSTCQAERFSAVRMVAHLVVRHHRLPYGDHLPGTPLAFNVLEWDFVDGTRIVVYVPEGGRVHRRAVLEVGPDGLAEAAMEGRPADDAHGTEVAY